jgi:hypothetical protein
MGLALPSALACLTTTPTPPLQGSSSTPLHPLREVGASLAEHRAATTLQCWKRHIWLWCWFDQQLQKKQKRLHLQTLCRGASAYARSVRDHRPPPIPTDTKSSDPKALCHTFRTRGQLLLQRKRVRRCKHPRCCPGQRHRPRASDPEDSGGGPPCMPMAFWAAQTTAALPQLGVRRDCSTFRSYLTSHAAAMHIQHAFQSLAQQSANKEIALEAQLMGLYNKKIALEAHLMGLYNKKIAIEMVLFEIQACFCWLKDRIDAHYEPP